MMSSSLTNKQDVAMSNGNSDHDIDEQVHQGIYEDTIFVEYEFLQMFSTDVIFN